MKVLRINAWVMVFSALAVLITAMFFAPVVFTEAIVMAFIVGAVAIAKDLITPDPPPVVPAFIVEKMLDRCECECDWQVIEVEHEFESEPRDA